VEHRRVDRDRATPLRKESALTVLALDSRFRDMVLSVRLSAYGIKSGWCHAKSVLEAKLLERRVSHTAALCAIRYHAITRDGAQIRMSIHLASKYRHAIGADQANRQTKYAATQNADL
jgi:hypothetical protein